MASTKYTYSVSNDTLNGKVSLTSLQEEINAESTIIVGIDPKGLQRSADVLDIWFKAALSAAEQTALGTVVSLHAGVPPTDPVTADGVPIVQVQTSETGYRGEPIFSSVVPSGGGQRWISHNFCDRSTWWQGSLHVMSASYVASGSAASPTGSVDYRRYVLTQSLGPAIDVRHGRLVFEDKITSSTTAPNGNSMVDIVPTVFVDGSPFDQALEDSTNPDGYVIDYSGDEVSIVFASARASGSSVTACFRRSDSSAYTIEAASGKRITLEDAEVDLSEDFDMSSPFVTRVYGSHSILTAGQVVPVDTRTYKKFHDFHAAARKFWGPLPAGFGGQSGIATPKWTFQWEYMRSDDFYSTPCYIDQNVDTSQVTLNHIEVSMQDDEAAGGSVMTVAFFGAENEE